MIAYWTDKRPNGQQWAYLNALRAAAQQVTVLVDAEVKALDEESKQ